MQTSPPRGQKEWHTLMKILPCPKLRLRTVTSYLDHGRYISYVYLAIKSILYVFNCCHKKYTYITFLQNLQHVLPNSNSYTRLWLGTWSLIFCPSAEGRLSAAEMLLCALVKHISSQDFDKDRPNSHHYQPPKFMYWLCLQRSQNGHHLPNLEHFHIWRRQKIFWAAATKVSEPWNSHWLCHESNY